MIPCGAGLVAAGLIYLILPIGFLTILAMMIGGLTVRTIEVDEKTRPTVERWIAQVLFMGVFVADITMLSLPENPSMTRWLLPATGVAMLVSMILAYRNKPLTLSLRIGSTILSLGYGLFLFAVWGDWHSGNCGHGW